MTPIAARDAAAVGASAVALLLGTCVVPYWFPPARFVVGASYEVGFSNAVSFLMYAATLALLVLLIARLLPEPSFQAFNHLEWKASPFSYAIAAAVIAAHVLLFAALYAYKGRFVFAEGLYFQSLLHRMLQGEVPYIDFGFYYGPLMLYPAYWLSRLAGLDAGYALWYVSTYVIGLVFLFGVLSVCVNTARGAALWFIFLALGLFNPLTGLNVTFARYLFPTVVFALVLRFVRDGGFRWGLAAAATLACAVTYTFEVAALSVAATLLVVVAYVVPTLVSGIRILLVWLTGSSAADAAHTRPIVRSGTAFRRGAGLIAAAAVLCVGAFLALDPSGAALRGYPEIALSYSGGAHNVPIYPNLPFIGLVVISAVAFAALVRIVASFSGDPAAGAAALAYAAVAFVAQRAAFGAAEPSHFAYFGLPAFLIALFAASQFVLPVRLEIWVGAVLLVGIMLPMQYYHFTEFLPFVTARFQATVTAQAVDAPEVRSGADLESALRQVVQTLGHDRPYVMYEMEYSSLPVYREFGLRYPMYTTMLITARDHEGVSRAIRDVRGRRAIVIVRKDDLTGLRQPRRATTLSRILDVATGAHTGGSDLNGILLKSRTELTRPFLEFLENDCTRVYDHDGLVAFSAG